MAVSYEDQLVAQNVRIACENRRLRFTLELIAGFSDDAIESNPLASQLVGLGTDLQAKAPRSLTRPRRMTHSYSGGSHERAES